MRRVKVPWKLCGTWWRKCPAKTSEPKFYRDHFDADVLFEQDHSGFGLPANLLAMPLQRSDPEVRD